MTKVVLIHILKKMSEYEKLFSHHSNDIKTMPDTFSLTSAIHTMS